MISIQVMIMLLLGGIELPAHLWAVFPCQHMGKTDQLQPCIFASFQQSFEAMKFNKPC
jgi:hypothetical protein